MQSNVDEAISQLRKYFDENGILSQAEGIVKSYTKSAQEDLEIIPQNKRNQLDQLTEFVWKRKK